MSVSGRTFLLASLVVAAAVGCAPTEVGLFDEDAASLDRVRSIKIKVTTIGGVTGEDYPEIAWINVSRSYKQPYHPLTEGQLFGWAFLDQLSQERLDAEKRAEAPKKKKKRRVKAKPAKKAEPKKAKDAKAEPAKEDEPKDEPAPKEEEPSRRSRRSGR
jgi:hypothetical protein